MKQIQRHQTRRSGRSGRCYQRNNITPTRKDAMMKYLLIVLLLAGCATPESPQQSVFQAKSAYAVALTAAVAYKRLPDCARAAQPCSDKAVVAQLQKADTVASTALDSAEHAVRTPGFGQNVVSSAVAAAQAALQAFTSITATLGVR